MMKNIPLSVQIWLFCVGVTLSIFLLMALVLPYSLRSFFTAQVFDILMGSEPAINCGIAISEEPFISAGSTPVRNSIKMVEIQIESGSIEPINPDLLKIAVPAAKTNLSFAEGVIEGAIFSVVPAEFRVSNGIPLTNSSLPIVNYLMLGEGINTSRPSELPQGFFQSIKEDAQKQMDKVAQYTKEINNRTLYYVIRKSQINGLPASLVSYTWGSYRDDLAKQMLVRLGWVMMAAILGSLLPSILLARRLTKPLVQMENHMAQIAEGNLQQPVALKRRDEIGRLAKSFEQMRCRLLRQDEAQRSYHQNISHELKTPVMIIRSYSQSISDGIYPDGTLEGSLAVINKETDRLEKRIGDLIYLSKLNYLTTRDSERTIFALDWELRDCLERFKCRRSDIQFNVQINPVNIEGDQKQWRVVFENLLDNQIRYAGQCIEICLENRSGTGVLSISNDGPFIDEEQIKSLFEPFSTGNKGQFGLGLSIVREVVNLHKGSIKAENLNNGPCFLIEFPCMTN